MFGTKKRTVDNEKETMAKEEGEGEGEDDEIMEDVSEDSEEVAITKEVGDIFSGPSLTDIANDSRHGQNCAAKYCLENEVGFLGVISLQIATYLFVRKGIPIPQAYNCDPNAIEENNLARLYSTNADSIFETS